jgi:hypothetical protein
MIRISAGSKTSFIAAEGKMKATIIRLHRSRQNAI